jgi:hypothetical protein
MERARRLGHPYVGTEHLLLALLDDAEPVTMGVLASLDADPARVRKLVEEVKRKTLAPAEAPDAEQLLPYTPRLLRAMDRAAAEAHDLALSSVGPAFLLLGLLREEGGIAAQVLKDVGVSAPAARAELLRLLPSEIADPAERAMLAEGLDQLFKTAVGLIELHRLRFDAYPSSPRDLRFLGTRDRFALEVVEYRRLSDGYALDLIGGGEPLLAYPPEFARGLGMRRSNVLRQGTSQ